MNPLFQSGLNRRVPAQPFLSLKYLIASSLVTVFLAPAVFATTWDAAISGSDQQIVKGLGGALPWYTVGTPIQHYPLAAQTVLDMGTSILRVYIMNLDNVFDTNGNLVNTALADTMVSEIQWAASNGIPYNYTPGWNNLPSICFSNGVLLQQYEQAQCDAVVNMLAYFTNHGCALPLITTMANEPSAPVGFMTTVPIDQFQRVFQLCRTTMNNAGLSAEPLAFGENGECEYQLYYLNGDGFPALTSDPALDSAIGAFATHTYYPSLGYHQQYLASLNTWANGRDSWETEYCYNGDQVVAGKDYTTGMMERFISDMVLLQVNYWEMWEVWNNNGPAATDTLCSGDGISAVTLPPAYYVFKKVFGHVTPGSTVRTVSTYDPALNGSGTLASFMDLVAFVNSSNMTVVLVNPTTNAIAMNVTGLAGNSANVYQIATAASFNTDMTLISSLAVSGGTITNVNLAANSVTVIVTVPSATNTVTPIFSGLTSQTIAYGAPVTLTGTVSTNGAYPANGTTITVSINGTPQTTSISDSTGDFTINYTTTSLPASATPYTVTYVSGAVFGFNPATNSSTTLTVNPLPVVLTGTRPYDGTATASASILTVSNRVGSDSVTLSGSVGLAGSSVGPQAITSFGGLTLGGASAPSYTLTGASGLVTILSTNAVTPVFSGLASHSISLVTTNVTLTGTVSANGAYPASGTVITVGVNGSPQTTAVSDSTGDFTINYNTIGLPPSATPYTVTYTSAAVIGFNAATDSSTTLTIAAGGASPGITNLFGVFNSSANTAAWVNGEGQGSASFLAGDAPPGGPSSGCLLFQAPYGGSGDATWQGIKNNESLDLNVTNCTALEMDVKIEGPLDRYGQIDSFQPVLQTGGSLVWMSWTGTGANPALYPVSTNNGWQHISIPASGLDGGNINNWSDIAWLLLNVYDGDYTNAQTMAIGYANLKFTAPGVAYTNTATTPAFSGLTSHTIAYGAGSVTLTGTVSANNACPVNGTIITVSVNGSPQTTAVSDSAGDFTINYNTTGLPASLAPYTVAYLSPAGGGFNAATNTSTTLAILAPSQLGGVSVSGTRLVFSYTTVAGQSYQLEYTTNLTSDAWLPVGGSVLGAGAPVWVTNSISSSMQQQFFRLSVSP